jgi:hypothetical protein
LSIDFNEDPTLWLPTIKKLASEVKHIQGDFVECGVFSGYSAKALAQECQSTLHLFDSWEGVSELQESDNNLYIELNWKMDLETAQSNLSEHKNLIFYKGWFPERFNEIKDINISLLHIDCSLYQPTKDSLEAFWPQISTGGYAVCNTHGGLSTGPEKAIREFFEGKTELIQYPTGILVAIKK